MKTHITKFSVGDKVRIESCRYPTEMYSEDHSHLIGKEGEVLSIVIKKDHHNSVVRVDGWQRPFLDDELTSAT